MKRIRFPLCLLCSCSVAIFGVQFAFAASGSSKAEFLLPVIEMLYNILLTEWRICGGICLIGAVYAVVFVLRRIRKPSQKTRKEVKFE